MKRSFPLLSSFALALGLTLGMASCSDSDLDTSNGNNSGDITNLEQADKYNALLRLMSAVADADSLPDNWNADGFSLEPTIGKQASDDNAFVRLVPTRSAEEADRQFRCMIGDAITGKATDGEWSQEGIGSLKFKVQNQADLYATIDVDVKQLPHLTQIRFVPASALGDNGWLTKIKSTYYQFGDVIKQTINGTDTYWVCVRPCSVEGNLGKSHWCTFQLQPEKTSEANYKQLGTQGDNLTLPTKLCSKEADGQKMTQNFFNVLRVIANPDAYKGASGIDDITTKEFAYDDARNISNLWKRNEIWDKVYSSELQYAMGNSKCELGAYYYGYNTVYVGKGDYRMYRLDMESKAKSSMFETATPTNPWVLKTSYADYSIRDNQKFTFENEQGYEEEYKLKTLNVALPGNNVQGDQEKGPDLQFIVKYRTGAELENAWANNDKTPATSFADRTSKNNITDVFVSKKLLTDDNAYERKHEAFFSIGDKVYLTKNFDGKQLCIMMANPNYNKKLGALEKNKTYFVCSSKGKLVDGATDKGVTISKELAATIMYQFLVVFAENDNCEVPPYIDEDEEKSEFRGYSSWLCELNNVLKLANSYNNTDVLTTGSWENDNLLKVKANINSTCYELVYNKTTQKSTLNYWTELDTKLNTIRVYAYEETHANKESYSLKNELVPESGRAAIKEKTVTYINRFLENCTIK